MRQNRQITEEMTSVKQRSILRYKARAEWGPVHRKDILVGLGETLVHIGLI